MGDPNRDIPPFRPRGQAHAARGAPGDRAARPRRGGGRRGRLDRRAQLPDRRRQGSGAVPRRRRSRARPRRSGRPAARRWSRPSARRSCRPCSPRASGARRSSRPRSPRTRRSAHRRARPAAARASNALSSRLVGIYRAGMPDATTLLLDADGFDDLHDAGRVPDARIEEADAGLVARVRTLRDAVDRRLAAVEDAEQRAEDYNEQIAAARDQIAVGARRRRGRGRAPRRRCATSARPRSPACSRRSAPGPTEVQRLERISAQQAQSEVRTGSATGRSPSRS